MTCPRCGANEWSLDDHKETIEVLCRNCGGWIGNLDQNITIVDHSNSVREALLEKEV